MDALSDDDNDRLQLQFVQSFLRHQVNQVLQLLDVQLVPLKHHFLKGVVLICRLRGFKVQLLLLHVLQYVFGGEAPLDLQDNLDNLGAVLQHELGLVFLLSELNEVLFPPFQVLLHGVEHVLHQLGHPVLDLVLHLHVLPSGSINNKRPII